VRAAPWLLVASWSVALSFLAELHAPVVQMAFARLLVRALGTLGVMLINSSLLIPLVRLLASAAAATVVCDAYARPPLAGNGASDSCAIESTAKNQRCRRWRKLLLVSVSVGLASTALRANGQLDDFTVYRLAEHVCRGEWQPVFEAAARSASRLYYAFWAASGGNGWPPAPPGELDQDARAQACLELGVALDASAAEIKAAHRALVLEHHPDKAMGRGSSPAEVEAAELRFRAIQDAYDTLTAK